MLCTLDYILYDPQERTHLQTPYFLELLVSYNIAATDFFLVQKHEVGEAKAMHPLNRSIWQNKLRFNEESLFITVIFWAEFTENVPAFSADVL